MLNRIRKINLQKAGIGACIVGLINIAIHILVINQLIPYTWVNGGRTESIIVARELSISSIIMTIFNILIALIASQIIPIKLNYFFGKALSIFLIITLPFSFLGIVQQFLGTTFEKIIMSVVTIMGFCCDVRIAFEKRG